MHSNTKEVERKRAHSFVPQLLLHLKANASFHCKLSELPKSYRKQPYNLAAKVTERGGIKCKIMVNRKGDSFIIMRY